MSGSLPSWARKGVKVVCVDASPPKFGWRKDVLELGRVYTVRGACIAPTGNAGVLMAGVCAGEWHTGNERGWWPWRFSPLVILGSDANDVAQFRKLLTIRQPEGIDA
jgi:hypothetical protein